MSEQPQLQSFNEVNLNAIKNTKLFQKFMQNKSGLLANSSKTNLKANNPKIQQSNVQFQNNESKWKGNRKVVLNATNQDNEEGQFDSQEQKYQQGSKNRYGPEQQQIQSFNNKQEQSYVEPYNQTYVKQKSDNPINQNTTRSKMQRLEEQAFGIEQELTDMNRNSTTNPSNNSNKRKRNFNPQSIPSNRQQPHVEAMNNNNKFIQQVQYQTLPTNSEWNNNNKTNISHNHSSSQLNPQRENNLNYNNICQQEFEKYTKVQHSPGRLNNTKTNTYSHSYNLHYNNNLQKPLDHSQSPPVVQKTPLSVAYSEGEYKQKYQAMVRKYEQLKQEVKTQSKNRKKQSSDWQHQIQMLKEKLFDVQSRQDSLLIQNQRLKQKWDSQNLLKMKTQEQNKQLTFRIKQLEDQLSMREAVIKQRTDQTNYWKAQTDQMKQDLNMVRLGLEKRNDEYNLLYGDYQIVKKERDNKDYLLEDLRRNIAFLVEENSAAKDQIFKLVTKLYQMEQENQVLKNDLKRQQFDTSQIHNFMKDLQQQTSYTSTNTNRERIQSSYVDRPNQNHYEPHIAMDRNLAHHNNNNRNNESFSMNREPLNRPSLTQQERPNMEKPARRRGEFAKERGLLTRNEKSQRDQRPLQTRQQNMSISQQRTFKTNPSSSKPITQVNNGNKQARIQQICEELERIKDMKAMNGAIRRKKIQLERQLQDLETR